MSVATATTFEFKRIGDIVQEQDELVGDYTILQNGQFVGYISISEFMGERYVSTETPDVNFSLKDWICFLQTIQEHFKLDDAQSIMMNKYPNAIEQLA